MKFTKELAINVGLAFVAGTVSTFGAFMAATPKHPGTSALIAAAAGGLYAGFRAAVGYIALNTSVPAIPVDE